MSGFITGLTVAALITDNSEFITGVDATPRYWLSLATKRVP